jgi:hypothetical protein
VCMCVCVCVCVCMCVCVCVCMCVCVCVCVRVYHIDHIRQQHGDGSNRSHVNSQAHTEKGNV